MNSGKSILTGKFLPGINKGFYLGNVAWCPHTEYRFSVYSHVTRVAECRKQMMEMNHMVIHAIIHFHNHGIPPMALAFNPCLIGPIMVCPAEAEGEVGFSRCKHLIKGTFQQLFPTAEPIMIIAESFNSSFSCQLGLLFSYLWQTQIIKTQISRYTGLVVSFEQRSCLCHVCPFGKSLSPPLVILRYGMVLR